MKKNRLDNEQNEKEDKNRNILPPRRNMNNKAEKKVSSACNSMWNKIPKSVIPTFDNLSHSLSPCFLKKYPHSLSHVASIPTFFLTP